MRPDRLRICYVRRTTDFPVWGLTSNEKCAKLHVIKGCEEDTRPGGIPREKATLVQGFCIAAGIDTTSEPQAGNGLPGTPVTASMSDGVCRNQGGTVEYICIPPLIFQGVGIFYTSPQFKRR